MIDGTERPIARPKDAERQKEHYSGKKRRHTRKHLAAVDEGKRVLVLSEAREGKVHDKRLLDEEAVVEGIGDEIVIAVDLGFLGLQKEYDNIELLANCHPLMLRLNTSINTAKYTNSLHNFTYVISPTYSWSGRSITIPSTRFG